MTFCHLLLTMPKTYNAVGKAFKTTITEELNLALKKGRLKDVEAKQGTSKQKPITAVMKTSKFQH